MNRGVAVVLTFATSFALSSVWSCGSESDDVSRVEDERTATSPEGVPDSDDDPTATPCVCEEPPSPDGDFNVTQITMDGMPSMPEGYSVALRGDRALITYSRDDVDVTIAYALSE